MFIVNQQTVPPFSTVLVCKRSIIKHLFKNKKKTLGAIIC